MLSEQTHYKKEAEWNLLKQVWYCSSKTPGRGISVKGYHSPVIPSTPESTSTESSFKKSIVNNQYDMHTSDTSQAEDCGMHARNAKQYKQIKSRMVRKLNQQEVELEQKDQEIARLVTEVERLQRVFQACTFELRETQIEVRKDFRYINAILETGQMLQADNMALKDLVSGLSDLRKENEKQKGRILELAYYCKSWGKIVTMLKEAEALNDSLRRMFPIEASSSPRYTCNFGVFFPSYRQATGPSGSPTSTSGSLYNHTKLLNPEASCFKSITHRQSPNTQFTDDEKSILNEHIGNPNQTPQRDTKKASFFESEMKRKFAETCKEDHDESWPNFHDNFAVKVELPVFMPNSSRRSHEQPGNAKTMKLRGKDDRACDFTPAKQGKSGTAVEGHQFLVDAFLSPNDEKICQKFGFEDLYSAAAVKKKIVG